MSDIIVDHTFQSPKSQFPRLTRQYIYVTNNLVQGHAVRHGITVLQYQWSISEERYSTEILDAVFQNFPMHEDIPPRKALLYDAKTEQHTRV